MKVSHTPFNSTGSNCSEGLLSSSVSSSSGTTITIPHCRQVNKLLVPPPNQCYNIITEDWKCHKFHRHLKEHTKIGRYFLDKLFFTYSRTCSKCNALLISHLSSIFYILTLKVTMNLKTFDLLQQ